MAKKNPDLPKIFMLIFPKKLFTLGWLNKLDEQQQIGPYRSPNLSEFNIVNYQKALETGQVLVL